MSTADAGSRAAGRVETAHQLYREGRHLEALESYTEALAVAKTNAQRIALHSNRAACHLKLHHFRKVVDECTAVLELDSRHTGALMLRAQTLVTLEEFHSALFDVNILMELNPLSQVYRNLQARLKTQLSLASIPESEEEFSHEDVQLQDDDPKNFVSAQVLLSEVVHPKAFGSKACSWVAETDIDRKCKLERPNSVTKTAQSDRILLPSEKWESLIGNESSTMQKQNSNVSKMQNNRTEFDMGSNIMQKENNRMQGSIQDKRYEVSMIWESRVEEKKNIKSMDMHNTKSEFSMALEAKMAPRKAFNTSADEPSQMSLLASTKEVSKMTIDDLPDARNNKNGLTGTRETIETRNNVDTVPGTSNQTDRSMVIKEVNVTQRKKGDDFRVVQQRRLETVPKPKGHSGLDYSRWDHVLDDSSEDEDDKEAEQQQPRYRFRVKSVGVGSVK